MIVLRLLSSGAAALAVIAVWAALAGPAGATEAFDPEGAQACETTRWARLERLEDLDPRLVQERFIPLVEHEDPEVVAAFGGDASPPSSRFLLHYAEGWDRATEPFPVLLVPGAGVSANHCFADRPIGQPGEGLAARLARDGRAVFALTFAHPHGDNLLQAEVLADAIERVRRVTGGERVDLVAWSKGGVAARVYLSDAGLPWSTRCRGDVRRYVMLGTPNGGVDVGFAYPNLNYWILENRSPAPLSWTRCLWRGAWHDVVERSLYAPGAFPGQAQMVARWDGRYGRTRAAGQWDVDTTYEGGRGKVSESGGIERAIREGGDLIGRLRAKGVHPSVELAVLAGTHPWIVGQVGERRGPSDGLVLVASVLEVEPMTRRKARVLRRELRALNHLQLVYDSRANDWVAEVLR
ncbi:MAG: acetyltransferase [Planctomycetes bacterium]|nr:acetyltransferase [Planctomycetota bacterium]